MTSSLTVPTRSIWLVNTDTGGAVAAQRRRTLPSRRDGPPDGQRLAYIATGAKHGSQIYVRWIRTGQTTCVTDLTQAPDNITWSPDGRFIAFTQFSPEGKSHLGTLLPIPEGAAWAESPTLITDITYRDDGAGYRQPGYSHVFVVSASGGYTRQLTFGAFDDKGPLSWTVDGKSVLLSGNRAEGWQRDSITSHLYRVSVEDLVVKPLTGRSGAESAPRVSPNGKQIAYLRSADPVRGYENAQLYVMDIDGTQGRSLTDELDRSVDDFQWSGDGAQPIHPLHGPLGHQGSASRTRRTSAACGRGVEPLHARSTLLRRRIHGVGQRNRRVHGRHPRASVGFVDRTRRK